MSSVPKLAPPEISEEIAKHISELQLRYLRSLQATASEAWLRTYMRAHPHKTVDAIQKLFPSVIAGTGEAGEHVFKVLHAIPRSPLDGPVDGRTIDVTPVPLREEPPSA